MSLIISPRFRHGFMTRAGRLAVPVRAPAPMSGRNTVSRPSAGRMEQTRYTNSMLVESARRPSTAAPRPARPKASPKNKPEMVPTLPGTSSCA